MKCTSIAVLAALSAASAQLIGWSGFAVPQEQKTAATESAGKSADEHPAPQVDKQAIQAELGKKTSLSFEGTSLQAAVESISRDHHLDIELDNAPQVDPKIDLSTELVSLTVKDVTLRSALRLMLSQLNLAYIIRDGSLFVTTKAEADTKLETTVYDVSDLLMRDDKGQPDFDSIINLLTSTVAPQSWSEQGGPAAIQSGPLGTLVITQTDEVQEQIAWILGELRKVKDRIKANKFESSLEFDTSAAAKLINKALNEKATFEFHGTPLKDVVGNLRQQNHIELQFDVATLKDAGLDPSTMQVSFQAQGIPLRFALRRILSPFNLSYDIRNEVLLITTKEKADNLMDLAIYPVGDLLSGGSDSADNSNFDAMGEIKTLMDDMTGTISATSWSNTGGPGTTQEYGEGTNAVIVVAQTADLQEQIADFLAATPTGTS